MSIKKKWMVLAIVLVGLCTVSCGDGDDNQDTEKSIDYIVTTVVKTAVLKEEINYSFSYRYNLQPTEAITIYQDFNYKYSLGKKDGYLFLYVSQRENGAWRTYPDSGGYGTSYIISINDGFATETFSVGKVSNINAIEVKINPKEAGSDSTHPIVGRSMVINPSYGYAMGFTTEDGIIKYLRVFIKYFELESNGALGDVTIQYQLY